MLELVRLGLTPETASSAVYIAIQLIGAGVIEGLVVPGLVKDAAAGGWGLRRGLRAFGRWLRRPYPLSWFAVVCTSATVGLAAVVAIQMPPPSDATWRGAFTDYYHCLTEDDRAALADSIVDGVLAEQPELSANRRFMDVTAAVYMNNEKAFVELMMQRLRESGEGAGKWAHTKFLISLGVNGCL